MVKCQNVFDEAEAEIPDGVEDIQTKKVENKLLGAFKKARKKGGRKKV